MPKQKYLKNTHLYFKTMKSKELPAIIGSQNGRIFTRVHFNRNVYMYKVEKGIVTMYEVFKARSRDGLDMYPKREDFGKIAFGVSDYNEAEKLFNKMSNY